MKQTRRKARRRLARRHKNYVHFGLIGGIIVGMIADIKPVADWLFVVLAIVCEVA